MENLIAKVLFGEKIWLLADKAILWPSQGYLIVADVHLGKATHFSRNGSPLPPGKGRDDIDKLKQLCLQHDVRKLLILGDLFHSEINSEFQLLDALTETGDLKVELVAGNHDVIERRHFLDMGITVYETAFTRGPFEFVHDPLRPVAGNTEYRIGGHVHPGVRLYGKAKQSLKVPCFAFRKDHAVLPAFGSLTGQHEVKFDTDEDEIYAIAAGKVVKVPSPFRNVPSPAR